MSQIEVPNWVVEVAAKAMADSIGHGMTEKCEKHALAAIIAALGAWVVPVGWMVHAPDEPELGKWFWSIEEETPGSGVTSVPCYALRQEKPE